MKFRFTIGAKIGTGFGILIALTIAAFILTLVTLKDSRNKTDEVTELRNPSVAALKELESDLIRSRLLITKWYFVQKEGQEKDELRSLLNIEYPRMNKQINELAVKWSEYDQGLLKELFERIDIFFASYQNDVMDQLNSFESYDDAGVTFLVGEPFEALDEKYRVIRVSLLEIIAAQQNNANTVTKEMLTSFTRLKTVVLYFGWILVIGGILIAFLTVRTIVKPVKQLKRMLIMMGKGILPSERMRERKDEIGEMSIAMHGLIHGMSSTVEFANQVGSGNFDSVYQPLSNEDTLGHTLLKMRTELAENERILEAKVIERTEEVVRQKEEISKKSHELEDLYTQVTDSIKYAKRIQEAILPPDKIVKQNLPNSFVLFKPKDIVSGDFYWLHAKNGKTFYAAVDCTGHGVPGAFMSIVGYNLLESVITNNKEPQAASILDGLNKGVAGTLHQSQDESSTKDGMDISLCSIDFKTNELQYAGAYNPLYLVRKGELTEINADKFPIGSFVSHEKKFTNNIVQLQKGDNVYIATDGFADQFGGPKGKKFLIKRFRELLLSVSSLPVEEQKKTLNMTIEDWRGTYEQVDDILVIGLAIN